MRCGYYSVLTRFRWPGSKRKCLFFQVTDNLCILAAIKYYVYNKNAKDLVSAKILSINCTFLDFIVIKSNKMWVIRKHPKIYQRI